MYGERPQTFQRWRRAQRIVNTNPEEWQSAIDPTIMGFEAPTPKDTVTCTEMTRNTFADMTHSDL